MIDEGEQAPEFDLPAVVDSDIERVALDDYLGEVVVVLAFYPGDFNPACGETAGLDELDIFRMQKDVAVLGISGDSVYSHRAFAAEYRLGLPLLADVDGTVADAYGVATDAPTHGTDRAVVVVDLDGTVTYTWIADEREDLPVFEDLRGAFDAVTSDAVADEQYRGGYDRYTEGKKALAKAGTAYGDEKWLIAHGEFDTARTAFQDAARRFDTAARFSADDLVTRCADRAERATEALARTATHLQESAKFLADGDSAEGNARRRDADLSLARASELGEPLAPDAVPPEEPPADWGAEPPQTVADIDTSGSLDIDERLSASTGIETGGEDRTDLPDVLDRSRTDADDVSGETDSGDDHGTLDPGDPDTDE